MTARAADLDRRTLIGGGLALGGASVLYVAQEGVTRLAGLPGGERRFTGSHEVASYDPAEMPTVIWLDDTRPTDTEAGTWPLVIYGRQTSIASLRRQARPVVASLDCTGGWWSAQSRDAVSLYELVTAREGRSLRVRSETGYDRLFSYDDLEGLYLAVGYNGEPLRSGHGAPVRLIVPGRRGFWWVKWVTSIEADERPAWLQPPLPLT
ncbi:MAG: molybdopterin-dependent oxidoreductase [Dehalococcoidia bacterium]|nr:molybdopterin-dependent oxidoreductase [Dehalococcoidia bacterium]